MGQLLGLSVRVWASTRQDVSIIYAEPAKEDLNNLLRDKNLLDIVQEILWKEGGTVLHPVLSKEPKNGELPNLKVLVPELNILKTGADVSDSIHHNDGDGPCDDDQEQEDGDHDDDDVGEDALEVKDEDEDQDGDSLMPAQRVAEILPVVSSKHQHEKQGLLWKRRKSRHAFKCSQCEETLDSKASLREHVRVQHQVERRVQCSFCEYVAPSPDYCLIHEKKIHLNLRCAACRKLFDSAEEKADHVCIIPDRLACRQGCGLSFLRIRILSQ